MTTENMNNLGEIQTQVLSLLEQGDSGYANGSLPDFEVYEWLYGNEGLRDSKKMYGIQRAMRTLARRRLVEIDEYVEYRTFVSVTPLAA